MNKIFPLIPKTKVSKEEQKRLLKLIRYEKDARKKGFNLIAGVDEAGRGPLAGPVVAAACILPEGALFEGMNDSKLVPPDKRQLLFEKLTTHPGVRYGIGIVDVNEIDAINIYQASLKAMHIAIRGLPITPDLLLVDGVKLPHETLSSQTIIKGDALSHSIAAASIIAKSVRDQIMIRFHDQWPAYRFNEHKGYATPDHLENLERYGPSPIHRRSFDPLKTRLSFLDFLKQQKQTILSIFASIEINTP